MVFKYFAKKTVVEAVADLVEDLGHVGVGQAPLVGLGLLDLHEERLVQTGHATPLHVAVQVAGLIRN